MVKITFLGTGTSQGVPIIGCECAICQSENPKDNRLRCSIWVQTPEASIIIDTGPDFRTQMLRAKVKRVDAVLFTHAHKDHLAGLDDVRAYNFIDNKPMPVYATEETQIVLRKEYSYIFENASYPGVPQITLNTINGSDPIYINGLKIIPIRVLHYKLEVLGFRIGNFTYITDVNYIAPEELAKTAHSDVLVLTALRHEKHISHYTLAEAIEVACSAEGIKNVYFTHISHQLGLHDEVSATLPPHMFLAYDGLTIETT